ncbi:multicopper oxidase family protein [Saccharothrix syringae]|uniref:multicopper oxidase family protein n=1 Tax=Saccharothrix syringae TaxID=103733 RepID=UPI001D1757C2|nr:multicopper oxidase domain-containing protein [Saccharothrix syringae]
MGAASLGAGALAAAGCGTGSSAGPAGGAPVRNPLRVPPLAESAQVGGRRVFSLVAQAGRTAFVPGGEAETWGFNGSFLGPTLRVRRGEDVRVVVRNGLSEPTTVHWHGMVLPASADGTPHQTVEPGGEWSPSWRVDQPAATLWYHPHPHGATERHVHRGLAGMLIVDDDEEAALDLPREYGVDDVPVIVQDRTFGGGGAFVEGPRSGAGMLGSTILVNGTASPGFAVTAELTRLRLLNASTARSYRFGFPDGREFDVVAGDGGLLPAPVKRARLTLTPGERAEVVVRLSAGEQVVLRSYPQELGVAGADTGAADEFDVLHLGAAASLRPSAPLPARLVDVPVLDPAGAVAVRGFRMRVDRINDERMDLARVDHVVTVGTTELWDVVNVSDVPHNFHVHGTQFQVVSVGGRAPAAESAGWKDTVYAPPNVPVRLAVRFTGHADPSTPYMYHCHLLWHEDSGVMGQFVVVEPGGQARPPVGGHAHR